MTTDEPLWFAEFTKLSDGLRSGLLTSVKLAEMMLERIAVHDPELHSYSAVAPEFALQRARLADAEIGSGNWRGPLHGIPMAVKDAFATKDIPTGFGSPVFASAKIDRESTATDRLNQAGAVMLGKLTLTEGVYADHHPTITPPINPFGAGHWTGTSSSGSGVAVTAGLAYATLGTDTGGSIRLPSSCCGVVGIKPTWGRVSRYGVFPLAESLDHIGPMARSVADAAALLGIIAGSDINDPTAAPVMVDDYLAAARAADASDLTIGIDRRFIASRATDEVQASIEGVVRVMRDLGARFVDVEFPDPDSVLRGWAVQCAVECALAHEGSYPERQAEYGERLSALIDRGRRHSARDMAVAMQDRREFNGRMAAMFSGIDTLLVPGLPVAGPSLDFMASLGEDPAAILAIGPFTAPFDVCGYPTITLPCGMSDKGIPIGFQFVGRPFSEALLCRAGGAYQAQTSFHHRRPDL